MAFKYYTKDTIRGLVPDVVGQLQATGETTLSGAGFDTDATEQSSEVVESGYIISQDPAGGTRALFGSIVDLAVSTGPGWPSAPWHYEFTSIDSDYWDNPGVGFSNGGSIDYKAGVPGAMLKFPVNNSSHAISSVFDLTGDFNIETKWYKDRPEGMDWTMALTAIKLSSGSPDWNNYMRISQYGNWPNEFMIPYSKVDGVLNDWGAGQVETGFKTDYDVRIIRSGSNVTFYHTHHTTGWTQVGGTYNCITDDVVVIIQAYGHYGDGAVVDGFVDTFDLNSGTMSNQ